MIIPLLILSLTMADTSQADSIAIFKSESTIEDITVIKSSKKIVDWKLADKQKELFSLSITADTTLFFQMDSTLTISEAARLFLLEVGKRFLKIVECEPDTLYVSPR